MQLAQNIKRLREEKGLLQKEVAAAIDVHPSNYSKMEKGERDVSIELADKLARFYGISLDGLVHMDDKLPRPVTVGDKTANEKVQLISQLDDDDRNAIYRIIDGMLTKYRFQTFFEQNIAK